MSVEEKNLIIYASLLGVALIVLLSVLFFTFYKVRQKMLLEKFEEQRRHQKELNNITLEIQNQTLKNIGRELHDNIGQKLTLASLQVGTMKVGSALKLEEQSLLSDILQESIKDLRSLSKTLNSDVVADNGLLFSIKQEVSRLDRLNYVQVKLQVLGKEYRLDREKELVLFRIFQEAINNILKHAQASCLHITLHYTNQEFILELEDDGVGFDIHSKQTSSGLKNMRSRAKLIQAAFYIKSNSLNGTKLKVTLSS